MQASFLWVNIRPIKITSLYYWIRPKQFLYKKSTKTWNTSISSLLFTERPFRQADYLHQISLFSFSIMYWKFWMFWMFWIFESFENWDIIAFLSILTSCQLFLNILTSPSILKCYNLSDLYRVFCWACDNWKTILL